MKLKILIFTCFLILIYSCEYESALDKYYNQEGNFSGSIYDAIDSTGKYKFFIEGIDSSALTNQLKNTLATVIAPSDEAFEAYFRKYGYTDLESIPAKELHKLISQHIITWPHSPTSFNTDPQRFKRISNMANGTDTIFDVVSNTKKIIATTSKYLQFYYPQMMNFYGGTDDDYKMLTGADLSKETGFNVYNVPVDSIVPYGNGWVYYVSQVIEPFQNLDEWLRNAPDYDVFNILYNRFNSYTILSRINPRIPLKRSSLYQTNRGYRVDMELCYEEVGINPQSTPEYPLKGYSGYTVMAPQNDAILSFIDTQLKDYEGFKDSLFIVDRTSLSNLHLEKIVRAMLMPYMFIEKLVFPSNFLTGEGVNGSDGTPLKFNPEDIAEYTLCSNGYAYGLKKYIVPRSFKSVLKPAYTTPDYKYFTAVVEAAKTNGFLNDAKAVYTVFIPTDEAFIKNNIVLVDPVTYANDYGGTGDATIGTTRFLDLSNPKAPAQLDVQILFALVFNHLITQEVALTSQKQYFVNAIGRHVGVTKDSIWSGGNIIGQTGSRTVIPKIVDDLVRFDTDNGRVYVVDDMIKSPVFSIGDIIKMNPDYSRFKDLIDNAELFLANGELLIKGDYPTVFIPTNEAINQFVSEGKLPSDTESLGVFLKYFFINNAIYSSETIDKKVATLCRDEELSTEFKIVYKDVEIKGTYENMKIKGTNNSAFLNVIEGAASNVICTDGIIHQIDGVLN